MDLRKGYLRKGFRVTNCVSFYHLRQGGIAVVIVLLHLFHGFTYSSVYYLSPLAPPMESRVCPRGAPSLLINMRVPDLHEGYLRKGIRHLHLCLMLVFTQRPLYSTVKKTHGMFCNFLFHTQHQESTI